jgi:hypothetical protein
MTSRPGPRLAALAAAVLMCCAGGPPASRFVLPPPPPRPPDVPADALFFDDFSRGLGRWTVDRDSVWSVHRGMLCADLPDGRQLRSFAYAGSERWGDYAVDLDVCQIRGVDKGVVVRVRDGSGTGVDARGPGYQDVLLYRREIPLGHARALSGNGAWHHLQVECRGNSVRVLLDGVAVLQRGDARAPGGTGRIALPAYTGGAGECTVYYDNVLVTPLR